MAVDGSLIFDTKIDTNGFKAGTNTIKSQANGLKGVLASLGKTMALVFGVKKLIQYGKQAIETASDLKEVQNVVDTAFGSMAYKMEEFAKTSIETYGLSKLASKEMGSLFMAMSTGMNQASDVASDMAVNITGRLGDIMSFYNKTKEEVQTIGKAIYTGETEPLKAIGLVATEANLSVFAMQNGFNKAYKDMAANEKLLVRQQYFLAQTSIAAGDFADTSDSWANQTRVLSERWKEFLGILGQGLIQVLAPVVRYLNTAMAYLIQFANTVGKVLSSVFNLGTATKDVSKNTAAIAVSTEDAGTGISDMGNATKKAAKQAKSGTASFDQLNNMTESIAKNSEDASSAISGIGGLSSGPMNIETPTIEAMDTTMIEDSLIASIERIKTVLLSFITYLKTNFGPIFTNIWASLQPGIQNFKTIIVGVFNDLKTLGQPLLQYFIGSFIPGIQQAITTIGEIVVGLFNIFNMVFGDIWNLAVFPILQNFILVALPMLAEFGTKTWEVLGVLFEEIKKIFTMIWQDAIAPALALCTEIWISFVNTIKEFWDKWGEPIFENIKIAFKKTGELLSSVWKSIIKPVWDTFMEVLDQLWTEHFQPLLANILDFIGELANGALEIYNKFIQPLVKWFVEVIGPVIGEFISRTIESFGGFLGDLIDIVDGVITALKGIVQFITGVFTGNWKKAWTGIKTIFKGIFDSLVGIVKTPINLIIDLINGLIGGIVSGVNSVVRAINTIKFSVPDWVPGIGGNSVGFDIKEVTAPKIPRLATGTVVPANYGEFLAILGDNKRETEVVSPLSTIEQALSNVLSKTGGGTGTELHLHVYEDGKQRFETVVKYEKENYNKTGKSVFVH